MTENNEMAVSKCENYVENLHPSVKPSSVKQNIRTHPPAKSGFGLQAGSYKGLQNPQTSMSYAGFEPRPYGTAVSVTNHYTGWAVVRVSDNACYVLSTFKGHRCPYKKYWRLDKSGDRGGQWTGPPRAPNIAFNQLYLSVKFAEKHYLVCTNPCSSCNPSTIDLRMLSYIVPPTLENYRSGNKK
ncbi:hypothetical protein TNCV_5010541 [Trichonephila clavipes]|nr:hypothetical protein TNCV_5010541 [Trichonephila clavipes]